MSRTFKKFKVAEKNEKHGRTKRSKNNWAKSGKKRIHNIELQEEEG